MVCRRLYPGCCCFFRQKHEQTDLLRNGNRGMYVRYIEIAGGKPLAGRITVQGSKNAVLPILTSCLLGEGTCQIENCPRISDVTVTLRLLESVGCKVIQEGSTVRVDASEANRSTIPSEEASHIRSSVLFLGALIGRFRQASLPMPGGCAIGIRPVDLHIRALTALGVRFERADVLTADGSMLHGARIHLTYPSVGATENSILAAVLAPGKTKITGAAREPEISELCRFLSLRGADIRNDECGTIVIRGVKRLKPVNYRMQADRIVTGTYLTAAAAAGGKIQIDNFPAQGLEMPLQVLRQTGAYIERKENLCILSSSQRPKAIPYLETAPYPGFPTDLQSPLLALLSGAQGMSCVRETVFENRFRVVRELRKLGADIEVQGDRVLVKGREKIAGGQADTPDLRGGAALVIAGLCASGLTRVSHIEYIERGYEDICRDFRILGGDLTVTERQQDSQVQ